MPRGKRKTDNTLLTMALVGYEAEKQKIDEKIRELRSQLGGKTTSAATTKSASAPSASGSGNGRKRRTLSAAARKRIAIAQKKRWAEHRKQEAGAE